MVRAADLITLPGMKKAPKKRIAAMLEPVEDGLPEVNDDALAESEEDNSSDAEDQGTFHLNVYKIVGFVDQKKRKKNLLFHFDYGLVAC